MHYSSDATQIASKRRSVGRSVRRSVRLYGGQPTEAFERTKADKQATHHEISSTGRISTATAHRFVLKQCRVRLKRRKHNIVNRRDGTPVNAAWVAVEVWQTRLRAPTQRTEHIRLSAYRLRAFVILYQILGDAMCVVLMSCLVNDCIEYMHALRFLSEQTTV
jgi:hypothetical protein